MRFTPAPLAGAFIVDVERFEDARGFFARTFCEQEFAAHGMAQRPMQSNVSFNAIRGTLRGMHFQRAPHAEAKLVRCTAGKIFDVIVDVRDAPEVEKSGKVEGAIQVARKSGVRVMAAITKAGGTLSQRGLTRATQRLDRRHRDAAIRTLLDAGRLGEVHNHGRNGQIVKSFQALTDDVSPDGVTGEILQ